MLALTPEIKTARRLALLWGAEPRVTVHPDSVENMTEIAIGIGTGIGLVGPGERLLVLAGMPFGAPGSANILRLAHAPR